MIYTATDGELQDMRRWLNEKLTDSDSAIRFHDRKLIEARIERDRTQALTGRIRGGNRETKGVG